MIKITLNNPETKLHILINYLPEIKLYDPGDRVTKSG